MRAAARASYAEPIQTGPLRTLPGTRPADTGQEGKEMAQDLTSKLRSAAVNMAEDAFKNLSGSDGGGKKKKSGAVTGGEGCGSWRWAGGARASREEGN